eukprot:CAMPEP_0184686190 /NCGR_PEP_ID=MMETSP0312-20130426/21575_1 /TAXON_ID=31354 /ORGANISM="Compsopogon coeruleus, Strain SAG 36.94" /LENGTH=66 /DNA_ID=CAMNT_0027141037 /DNA_START=114 /DNA_END=311 /DNA_ORIENTATION=+
MGTGKVWMGRFVFVLVVVLLLMEFLPGVWGGRDYYAVLGVGRDADLSEIKRAFRKKSVSMHPDKNK